MIGTLISHLLKESALLTALVDSNNIFPYVINEDTNLPAIIYTIDSVTPSYTKDGWAGDNITFSVVSFANSYGLLQEIAFEVRDAIELHSGTYEDITYWNILANSQDEGYNITEDVYLNRITFSVEITQY